LQKKDMEGERAAIVLPFAQAVKTFLLIF